jgi:ABC-type multidrug transport system ATPase subunit
MRQPNQQKEREGLRSSSFSSQATGVIIPDQARQSDVLRLGRWPDNNIILDSPGVSRHHATLAYGAAAQPLLTDLGSANGTFVNGRPLAKPALLAPDDLVAIGGYLLRVDGRRIQWYDLNKSRLCASHLTTKVGAKTILKDVSLALNQREFVGLIGPSGCGKSTLMDALSGLRPASSGTVLINELDLYANFDALRRSIGRVPQKDILFDALSIERTLYYAARLRLPEGVPPAQLNAVVDEVISTVGLQEQRATTFRQLSGGQQKRLSLGLELLTRPSFIFLDEPTSPLDPQTTENMMRLFRRLADEGRIVVMVTHRFEKFELMHQVAILARGGRLAFFGPPREALTYFGCREPGEIYRLIDERNPDQLSEAFRASPQYRRYVAERIAEAGQLSRPTIQAQFASRAKWQGAERRFGFGQWLALTQRFLETKLKDGRGTALLFVQPTVIALLLALITPAVRNDAITLFVTAIISIWFGANNSIREIVAEAPVYLRERAVNLKISSYVFSKFAVFSGVGLLQCLLFTGLLIGCGRLRIDDLGPLALILYLTTLSGTAMGLFCSALVNSSEKALGLLPLILIPQLLLSGFLKPLDDLHVKLSLGHKPVSAAEYQRFVAGRSAEPVTRIDGMGAIRPASQVMIARWSLDALAHAVSRRDPKTRDDLAARITVTEYERVFKGEAEDKINAAFERRWITDVAVLSLFILLFLALTMLALRRRDAL